MSEFDKLVMITKKTALEELVERFGTQDQARFYIEHSGASFEEYQDAHRKYLSSLAAVKSSIPDGLRKQTVDRTFLPNFIFGERDLVITLGPDGLVVNTAKYLAGQPLLAFNPDPQRFDGVLMPFSTEHARDVLRQVARGQFSASSLTMAKAELNDGQVLYAVNDLFVGQQTHVSARYQLSYQGRDENQISSGIIISTGAGSTGWFRSILTGAAGVAGSLTADESVMEIRNRYRFNWESDFLAFSVREPFVSNASSAELVFGRIEANARLEVTSQMPQNGVIFSDGIEADYLKFNSGTIARIGVAERRVNLITGV